jgi:hypothetical protein
MYYFSALDPNYRIKGSRDPLGFQSLWASAGHRAVKHLSTVSSNLRDFMILCYGIYLYGERDPKGFMPFFMKFEQLCAYARLIHNKERSFNGTDFVSKKAAEGKFYISMRDTILTNQRVYGVYGKYIRPLRDMKITSDERFAPIMENALSKTDKSALINLLQPLLEGKETRLTLNAEDLTPVAELLRTLTEDERTLYRDYILRVPTDESHPQNNLYDVVNQNQEILTINFQLHPIIQSLLSKPQTSDELRQALINIENTDKVLHPLNLIFTHLLSKPRWTNNEILSEPILKELPGKVDYIFLDDTLTRLNNMLGMSAVDLCKEIIKRNEEVSKSRGNKAWIEDEKNTFKILYGENGRKITEINNENSYEFPYFLNNYLGLFKQIEMK